MPYDLTGAVSPIGAAGPLWPAGPGAAQPVAAPAVGGEGAHAPGTQDARGQGEGDGRKDVGPAEKGGRSGSGKPGAESEQLTQEEQAKVRDLQARDREVRAHEQAHVSSGGRYVRGGAEYSYQVGPDGKRYAVGGEVGIDTSRESTPEATIRKAQVVRRAALAPAEPSGADRAVAAQASRMEAEARGAQARERQEEAEEARQAQAEKAQAADGETRKAAGAPEVEVESPGPPTPYEAAAGPPEVGRVIDLVA